MVVVKWSAFLPSTSSFLIQFPLKPTICWVKFVFENNENKQKEARFGPFRRRERDEPIYLKRNNHLNCHFVLQGREEYDEAADYDDYDYDKKKRK